MAETTEGGMRVRHYTPQDRVIRWAYMFNEVLPAQTSTCALFWRSAVVTPALIGGLIGVMSLVLAVLLWATGVGHWLFPDWSMFAPVESGAVDPRQPYWLAIVFGGAILAIGVTAGLERLGVWSWLHGFCYPVEIEGGLVKKGECPACDGGKLYLSEADGSWWCRKCRGVFVPPDDEATAVDAGAS